MIKVQNISYKIEEREILKDISFEVADNKDVLILGNSGVGKTSLLNILAGLVGTDSGEVLYDETNFTSLIAKQPKYILCDEPTSSLDDDNCKKIIELLKNTSEKIGSQLVIVTHDKRVKNYFKNTKTIELK